MRTTSRTTHTKPPHYVSSYPQLQLGNNEDILHHQPPRWMAGSKAKEEEEAQNGM